MDENYENWKHLAAGIIIEIIEDYRYSNDKYYKEAMLRWFDTAYGSTICELAGISPDFIKKEVQKNGKVDKTYLRNDY